MTKRVRYDLRHVGDGWVKAATAEKAPTPEPVPLVLPPRSEVAVFLNTLSVKESQPLVTLAVNWPSILLSRTAPSFRL